MVRAPQADRDAASGQGKPASGGAQRLAVCVATLARCGGHRAAGRACPAGRWAPSNGSLSASFGIRVSFEFAWRRHQYAGMESVLTLIVDPAAAGLDNSTVAEAAQALGAAGADTGQPDWLAPGIACDIAFEGPGRREAMAAARAALAGRPVDLVAQPAAGRRKSLLVADMESTIIDNEMIDELADVLGLGSEIAAITARAMNGEIDFAESLAERARMLAGMDEADLEGPRQRIRVNPGAAELVATMHAHGAFCALVTGGFSVYSGYVRELLGFDHDQANRLEIVDGKLTGGVRKPILDRHAKQAGLMRLCQELSITPRQAIAVGDGANDLAMVLSAGLGVAYRGKPVLAEAAAMRVDHGDLTALLYAQGYRAREITRATL